MTTTRNRMIALGASLAVAVPVGLVSITPASAAVSADTATMLQAMVAEEKLAHDVYVTLGETFPARQFDSIAASEARHQDALRALLTRYGVTDPTAGDAVGRFDDPAVQALYDSLITKGSVSAQAAAEVGIAVEKLDIADLKDALADKPPADVASVLRNLLNGSENHRDAFTRLADGSAQGTGAGSGGGQGHRGGQGHGRWGR